MGNYRFEDVAIRYCNVRMDFYLRLLSPSGQARRQMFIGSGALEASHPDSEDREKVKSTLAQEELALLEQERSLLDSQISALKAVLAKIVI